MRTRGPLYVYDGRDLFAVVEHRADGWHASIKGNSLGPFASAELAFAMINAKRSKVAAAPIAGERSADIKHVSRIRKRQWQADKHVRRGRRARVFC
jgi:hypothetical protein